jgi:hypothetical protein
MAGTFCGFIHGRACALTLEAIRIRVDAMKKNPAPGVSMSRALAEVEACDSQYRDGALQTTRRRTFAVRVRPLGLWLIVSLCLLPGIWSVLSALVRLALKWLLAALF